jgi:ribosome-binding factor A
MTKREERVQSQRQLKVGEEIRHALAYIMERGELRDPALQGRVITITEVRVSPDLRNATAFVMPLGGGEVDEVVEALRHARPFLRRMVAQAVKLRYVPDLSFQADGSFDAYGRIDALLHRPEVARDLRPHDEDPEEGGER